MIYYLKDGVYEEGLLKNAGSKAREDCEAIFNARGYLPLYITTSNKGIDNYNALKHELGKLKENDSIILSIALYFPTIRIKNILNDLKRRNIKTIVFVHDLNVIRRGFNYYQPWVRFPVPKHEVHNEEYELLKNADYIICHNYKMAKLLKKIFHKPKVFTLNCFDYLSNYEDISNVENKIEGVVVAGNLCKDKSTYLYSLPKDINFFLYGVGYDETFKQRNINYCGSFFPNELIQYIYIYTYGLIWDGNSTKKCSGRCGKYNKINNPHKLSLYLAAGLPVIVWAKSAIAKFVKDNEIGICVNNLDEIIDKIHECNYQKIKDNALKIGEKVRKGDFLNTCLNQLESNIKDTY